MDDLGKRIWILCLSLQGGKDDHEWQQLMLDTAQIMGMSPVCYPIVKKYPMEGKGGNGMTVFQPITESFLALDTWPDHDGAYLSIHSCKEFDGRQLTHWLEIDQGLVVIDSMSGSLGLANAVS